MDNPTIQKQRRLLRCAEVTTALGITVSTLYALMQAGRFPRPIKPSRGVSAWDSRWVDDYIEQLCKERDERDAKVDATISATAAGRPVRHPDDTFEPLGEPVARVIKKLGTKL
jgi:prophage regulatory protein